MLEQRTALSYLNFCVRLFVGEPSMFLEASYQTKEIEVN